MKRNYKVFGEACMHLAEGHNANKLKSFGGSYELFTTGSTKLKDVYGLMEFISEETGMFTSVYALNDSFINEMQINYYVGDSQWELDKQIE